MGERKGAYRFIVKKSEGMRTSEDERKISKCTFKKWYGSDWSGSGKGQVVGCRKRSSEPLVFPQLRRIS